MTTESEEPLSCRAYAVALSEGGRGFMNGLNANGLDL